MTNRRYDRQIRGVRAVATQRTRRVKGYFGPMVFMKMPHQKIEMIKIEIEVTQPRS
jgi:hypothetical protein